MALSKKPKPLPQPKATVNPAASTLNRTQNTLQGFGQSSAGLDANGQLVTDSVLDPTINNQIGLANTGITNSLQTFSQSPTSRLTSIQDGTNPFYNAQRTLQDRRFTDGLSTLTQDAVARGLQDSSVLGGRQAQLLNDAALFDIQSQQAALNQEQQLALQSLEAGGAYLDSNRALQAAQQQDAANRLQTEWGRQIQNEQFNNSLQFQRDMAQAQQQSTQTGFGKAVGAGLTIGGALIGTAIAPGIGTVIGGAAGGALAGALPGAGGNGGSGGSGGGMNFQLPATFQMPQWGGKPPQPPSTPAPQISNAVRAGSSSFLNKGIF